MATVYKPQIVTNGLVFYLDANNPKTIVSGSTNAFDLSGNLVAGSVNSGSLFNGAFLNAVSGSAGPFIQFDGTNDYIQVQTSSLFSMSTPTGHTFEIVMRDDRTSFIIGGALPRIISTNDGTRELRFVQLGMAGFSGTRAFGAAFGSNAADFYILSGSGGVPSGINSITVTTTGSTVSRMYLNGVSYPNARSSYTGAGAGSGAGLNTFWIGQRGDNAGYAFLVSGSLFAIRRYNRQLSDAEVLQNFNASRTRFRL